LKVWFIIKGYHPLFVAPIRPNTLGFLSLYLVDFKCSPRFQRLGSRGAYNIVL
ncbi:hypothetical protein LINPERHAP1_LOCUS4807, partial [Linum perenne]